MASAALVQSLQQFTLKDVEGLDKRKEKGRGSYGAVYEVELSGVPCIAKRLHDILVGRGQEEPVSEEGKRETLRRFYEECVLLSGLRHPNIVQFMGVHYGGGDEADDISLIMEYMHMDLEHCMKTYPDIPLPYKTSILRDVAYGLAYLHSLNIIHRDLNAGNVLLTESLRAKIADLGVAKLFDRETAMIRTKTVCPGAHDFMPPESLNESPKYQTSLDIFSFGHLIIYLVNQRAPIVNDQTVTVTDLQKKQMQVGKRRRSLDQMGGFRHPLYSTVVQCLSDTPDQRPTSRDLVRRMEEICKQHPMPHKGIPAVLLQSHETEMLALQENNQIYLSEIVAYKKQLDSCKKELEEERSRGQQLEAENDQLNRGASNYQMEQTRADRLEQELQQLMGQHRELEKLNSQLKSSNQILSNRLKEAKNLSAKVTPTPHVSDQPRAQQYNPQLDHTAHPPSGPPAIYVRSQRRQLPWQQEPLYQQQHIYHHQSPIVPPQQQQQHHYYRDPVFPTSWSPPPAVEGSSLVSSKAELSYSPASSDDSDVADNPLIQGIDRDMMLADQDEVHKLYADPDDSINDPEQSFEIPFDPNLVCPKCGRQFRRGEIQKFRKHHEGCSGR